MTKKSGVADDFNMMKQSDTNTEADKEKANLSQMYAIMSSHPG
jgi:hypothetical protein